MPDKQSDNKFMAMLERRGIVRRADSEDDSPDPETSVAPLRPDADIRALFGSPAGDTKLVTPAARQPIPGMSSPVLPNERPQSTEREQPRQMESRVVELTGAEQPVAEEAQKTEQQRAAEFPKTEPSRAVEPQRAAPPQAAESSRTEQQRAAEPPITESFSGGPDPFADSPPRNEPYAAADGFGVSGYQQPQPEDYTDRYLDVDDLYEVLSIKSKRTDTIYLVEEYLKSLPDSLPDESRREIVSKIVTASGFDYDLLMGDGVLRVKMLKEYAERFARHTDDYVAARHAELDELDQHIMRIRKLIENRRELHKKQFFSIEAEAQRLKEILTFING